jgi:hypothetical protein
MAHLVAEKYAKTFLGEKDIKSVLDRLDRLTLEESKITAAQTLDVVCRLVNKMQVVMEGAHRQYVRVHAWYETNLVDGKASTDDIRQTLGESGWPA